MKASSTYDLILIGLRIRGLGNTAQDETKGFVQEILNKLKAELEDVGFEVSCAGFKGILESVLDGLETLDDGEMIGETIAEDIQQCMRILEATVFAESITKKIYTIPQRRFTGTYLSDSPEKLLKESVFENLSEISKIDFISACRCILYGEATASAFHMLRATEEVLKQFYFHNKKTNRLKKPMWGPMTNELRSKKTNKPSANILNALDNIRNSYRNPTQHPEKIYDIEEAQDLLGVCIDIINKMIIAIK